MGSAERTGRRALRRRAVTALVAIGCVAIVAGCSRDGSPDACDLLDGDEAAEILGVPTRDAELDTDRTVPSTYCRWVAEGSDPTEGADAAYAVWVAEGTDRDRRRDFERTRSSPPAEPIDGPGRDTFVVADEYGTTLYFRVGDRTVTIGVTGDDRHPVSPAEARTLELRVGEHVAERLS